MPALVFSGKDLAKKIRTELKEKTQCFAQNHGRVPGLAVILVGEDPASCVYVRNKEKACKEVGFASTLRRYPADISQEKLIETIHALNEDPAVDGILVQLPLPKGFDEKTVLASILPEKDVDGFHVVNAGKLLLGEGGVRACTPKGVMRILDAAGVALDGKHAVIVGRSNIVGKPLAMLLLERNATVTICHSHTKNLAEITRQADVLLVAVGKAELIRGNMIREGAVVIDVGINRTEEGLKGDVAYEEACQVASCITPVPGGVGPMTIAMLMENTLEAAERHG